MLSMPLAVSTVLPASMTACNESFLACAQSSCEVRYTPLMKSSAADACAGTSDIAAAAAHTMIRMFTPSVENSSEFERLSDLRHDHLGLSTLHALDELVRRLVD